MFVGYFYTLNLQVELAKQTQKKMSTTQNNAVEEESLDNIESAETETEQTKTIKNDNREHVNIVFIGHVDAGKSSTCVVLILPIFFLHENSLVWSNFVSHWSSRSQNIGKIQEGSQREEQRIMVHFIHYGFERRGTCQG